jgi:hypothetical protein
MGVWGKVMVLLLLAQALTLALGPLPAASAARDGQCLDCHAGPGAKAKLTMDPAELRASAHADLDCRDCHRRVVVEGHACRPKSGAVACADCHDQVDRHGGSEAQNRPHCHQCHTRHHILPSGDAASSTNPDRLAATCAQCHPAQSGHEDYLSWLPLVKIATHPKADFSAGRYRNDNCLGCHQGRASHGQAGALNQDPCGRCHMNAQGGNAMLGRFHAQADPDHQPVVYAAALAYQVVGAALLLGGLAFLLTRIFRRRRR